MHIYNKKLKKEIQDELLYLDETYFQVDEPIPFKESLIIYPVNMKNYNIFLACTECLTLNKLDDPEWKDKTHLEYLIHIMMDKEKGPTYSRYFSKLCELSLKIKNGYRCTKCGKVWEYLDFIKQISEKQENFKCDCGEFTFEEVLKFKTNPETKEKELVINGVIITNQDFDRLRQIIMYQNLPDYKDDSWVDIELRKDQEETARLRAKAKGSVSATLEKKIVAISVKTGLTIDYIYTMTIRKFIMVLETMDDLITYETSRIGLMTGMVSSKEPLEHWIYKDNNKDMYGKAVGLDDLQNKIDGKQM